MSPDPETQSFLRTTNDGVQQLIGASSNKALETDKEIKKELVLDVVKSYCNESSEYETLRAIGNAIQAGKTLNIKVISGGLTNYSYKLFLEDGSSSIAIYAKICFSTALWIPDKNIHYDVARVANEYKIMKHCKKLMGEEALVADPYICVPVEDDMMVLVTEWASADEQWANQFIDGQVDIRIIIKLAQALATLNLAPFDNEIGIDFNDNVRPCFSSMFQVFKDNFHRKLQTSDASMDPCIAHMKAMGQDTFDSIVDNSKQNYERRECLNHRDCHCFNLLVEQKPNDFIKSFGVNGNLIICDWEMAMAGPFGTDAGVFQSWPIACAMMHAAHGREDTSHEIIQYCTRFWDEYSRIIVRDGNKDERSMARIFQTCMGWAGMYLFYIDYLGGAFNENLPTENISDDMIARGIGAIGVTGLSFLEIAFGSGDSEFALDDLRCRFQTIVEAQINALVKASSRYGVHDRNSSLLRSSGRRVSDSMIMGNMAASHNVGSSILADSDIQELLHHSHSHSRAE
jgi:hypothetical protein